MKNCGSRSEPIARESNIEIGSNRRPYLAMVTGQPRPTEMQERLEARRIAGKEMSDRCEYINKRRGRKPRELSLSL